MKQLAMLHVAQWTNDGKSDHLQMGYYLDTHHLLVKDYSQYKATCLQLGITILITEERWDIAQE